MVNIPKVFQKTKEFVDDLDIGEFLENASIAEINEKLRSLTGKEKDDFIKQVNETGIPTSKPFEEKPKTKKQPEPEPEPEPEFIDESESKRTVGETYDVPDLPPLNQINKSIKLSDDIFPKIDEKGETFYDQPFEGDDIVTSWLDDIIPPGMKYDKAENIDFDVFLQTKKAGFQKTLNKLAEKTQNFKINPKTKELYEAGKLQLASDLQHVSVTDQLNLISRKQDKADKLREVRFQRLKKLQRDLRAQKLNKYKPILVTTDESVEPVTKFLTPDGYVIPYTKIYRKVNNFINRKDTNLITVPRGTLKARAEMAVMGHTMRGLSLKDPENIVRLANGDDQIRGALEEARDAFTPAMEKLLDQKDSLTQGPLREKLIQVARRYKPGLTESEINAHLLDLSHIFPFKKTGEVNPNSMFMGLGGTLNLFIYLLHISTERYKQLWKIKQPLQ